MKAIPNPNKRFMTLAEALVAGEAISEPNEAIQRAGAVEEVIEVGGMEEDERSNSEEEELTVVGITGRWVLHGTPNFLVTLIASQKIHKVERILEWQIGCLSYAWATWTAVQRLRSSNPKATIKIASSHIVRLHVKIKSLIYSKQLVRSSLLGNSC
ncbi:hypothetical protein HZ326_31579 [Fusarium oxysporum f. sp. albedinis]|nr:hypothetical protein HZ326_31579 [Fusarium oxysporum f. sp. albedinis]